GLLELEELLLLRAVRVELHADLGAGHDLEAAAAGVQDPDELLPAEETRRAATEVDGLDVELREGAQPVEALDLLAERLHVPLPDIDVLVDVHRVVTEVTLGAAKRDVHVQRASRRA